MKPDDLDEIVRALKRMRHRISSDEQHRLEVELEGLRRLQDSLSADREIVWADTINSEFQKGIGQRLVSYYQRLGRLEQAIDRLRRGFDPDSDAQRARRLPERE